MEGRKLLDCCHVARHQQARLWRLCHPLFAPVFNNQKLHSQVGSVSFWEAWSQTFGSSQCITHRDERTSADMLGACQQTFIDYVIDMKNRQIHWDNISCKCTAMMTNGCQYTFCATSWPKKRFWFCHISLLYIYIISIYLPHEIPSKYSWKPSVLMWPPSKSAHNLWQHAIGPDAAVVVRCPLSSWRHAPLATGVHLYAPSHGHTDMVLAFKAWGTQIHDLWMQHSTGLYP